MEEESEMDGWMDGSKLGCAAHVKGKCKLQHTVKEDEGMDGWDGMVDGTVRVQYGKVWV